MRGASHAVRAPASDSAGEKPKTAAKQRLLSGLYRSEDAGKTWRWMNDSDVRPFYYSQVRVDPKLPNRVYWSSTPLNFSDDGGKTVRNGTVGIHVDHHAMWIDPNDPEHFLVGDDGGVSQTWDRGGNYEFLNRIAIGQFYEVSYDMAVPYRVCGGLQDNGSWCGPSRKRGGAITNADWFTVGGGDGFYTAQDPTNPNIIYAESQGGNIRRLDYGTGESKPIVKPTWRPRYLQVRGLDPRRARRHDEARSRVDQEAARRAARNAGEGLDAISTCASTGTRRTSSRRTPHRRSTSAAIACSSPRTAATTSFRSRPTCPRATWRRFAGAWTPPAESRTTRPAPRRTARSWRWPSRTCSPDCCSPAPTTGTSGSRTTMARRGTISQAASPACRRRRTSCASSRRTSTAPRSTSRSTIIA